MGYLDDAMKKLFVLTIIFAFLNVALGANESLFATSHGASIEQSEHASTAAFVSCSNSTHHHNDSDSHSSHHDCDCHARCNGHQIALPLAHSRMSIASADAEQSFNLGAFLYQEPFSSSLKRPPIA